MELIKKYKEGKLTGADLNKLNNTIICLLVLIAVVSIVWSISIHIISGDLYYGVLGAKVIFRDRDFRQLDERSKEIFYQDLGNLINETYTPAALEAANQNDDIIQNDEVNTEKTQASKKPKVRKIAHLFQISSNTHAPNPKEDDDDDYDDDDDEYPITTMVPKVKFNMEEDRRFLATKTIDVHQTLVRQSSAVQFIYSYPFLSEIIAIIWAAMCLIFQTGVTRYWGLPKPWRIVIPSILMFSLMTVGTLIYTVLASNYLKTLCTGLRAELTKPDAISCGQAISVLRPVIRRHEFRHDVYLNLFRISYMLSLVMWMLVLLIMVLRYVFAIDFQMVEVQRIYECKVPEQTTRDPEFTEVLLNSPQHQTQQMQINERDHHKSEDDFQSAKSQLGEVATPLLEQTQQKVVV